MSWAIKVGGSRAITTLTTIKNTNIILMMSSCFFSFISLIILSLSKSSVRVELEVNTREDNVDMDADNTNTTTTPTRISGRVESIAGIIASYTILPLSE